MNLELNEAERKVLIDVMEDALAQTRVEVRRTRNPEWHEGLQEREEILIKLLEQFKNQAQ